MPRPRAIEPRRLVSFRIPESTMLRLEAALRDGALGRRQRLGDLSAIANTALKDWLAKAEAQQAPLSLLDLND